MGGDLNNAQKHLFDLQGRRVFVPTEQPSGTLPRITILTPSLNAARYIGAAIESARRQGYPGLEHIVLDAGSTDGTLEILARFPEIRVISESDRGAHDAMNEGVRRATGEVIGFLNVDDIYPDGLLRAVGRAFADDSELDVAVGRSMVFEEVEDGTRRVVVVRDYARENGFWLPELAFGAPGFNGRFFRRRVFDQIGPFDNGYYIAADRHFLIRIALAGLKAARLDRISIYYRLHAGSQTMNAQRRHAEAIAREHVRMAQEFVELTRGDRPRVQLFRAWRAFESVKLALRSLLAGRIGEGPGALTALTRRSPLWPLHFLHGLLLRNEVRNQERRGRAAAADALP